MKSVSGARRRIEALVVPSGSVLVALDFDGTLSADEMIVLLAKEAGVGGEVASITERAMAGELGYAESLRERVRLLEGLPEARMTAAYERVQLRPGMATLLDELTDRGVRVAVLTGGFDVGVHSALERAGTDVDRVVANRLHSTDGHLTGEVSGPLVEGSKDEALIEVTTALDIPTADTIAVGDGANDLPMLRRAGLAIGFRPTAAVAPVCDSVVSSVAELSAVLLSEE
jgi:phosphoserine phosphatase